METSPNAIRHLNKQRYTTANTYAEVGYLYSNLNQEIIAKIAWLLGDIYRTSEWTRVE